MNKIYIGFAAFLAAVAAYFYFMNNLRQNKIERLESQIISLKNDVKKKEQETQDCKNEISEFNAAQERAGKTIGKIRTVVHTVKNECDCYHIALPDDVRRLFGSVK